MEIDFDPAKNRANIIKHGIGLGAAKAFDWSSADIRSDNRRDYGEDRFIATGYLGDRLYVMIFTPRSGVVRAISLRKANKKEGKRYEKKVSRHG